ncbi:putative fasciclin-like arabinogalactan protein 20 [Euphorbia lathyris]|uniref:putative fasciclin-like arabinogalactan protein 20 n=1 Tax=Euphorbia lathyris TaxID=212925 RepID=UPI003313FB2B
MAAEVLIFLTLFCFLSFSSPLSTDSILDATNVLSNSGYNSMALTLEFASPTIIPIPSRSLTIFSPLDSAFSESGQPSLSLLQFHFSPLSLSMHSLKSLPPGTKIPTLFPNRSIIVTSSISADTFSLNGVGINGSVVYDDGSLVIFGIETFLDPNFEVFGSINGSPLQSFGCPAAAGNGSQSFEEAIRVLKFRGYSTMAWYLSLQLGEMKEQTRLTIFAPVDDEVMKCSWGDYRSIFRRHFVPCRISKNDMLNLENGVIIPTYLEGFMLNMRKYGDVLVPNEVRVAYPDMYSNDWLVVHGLRGSFAVIASSSSSRSSSSSCKNLNGTTPGAIVMLVAFLVIFLTESFYF